MIDFTYWRNGVRPYSTSVYIPGLDTWEMRNLYSQSPQEVKDYLGKYDGKDMKAVGHDTYKSTRESSPCSV